MTVAGQQVPPHRRVSLAVVRRPTVGEDPLLRCPVPTGHHYSLLSVVGKKIPPHYHLRLGSMKYQWSHPTCAEGVLFEFVGFHSSEI